jgi:hypothetical protein
LAHKHCGAVVIAALLFAPQTAEENQLAIALHAKTVNGRSKTRQ